MQNELLYLPLSKGAGKTAMMHVCIGCAEVRKRSFALTCAPRPLHPNGTWLEWVLIRAGKKYWILLGRENATEHPGDQQANDLRLVRDYVNDGKERARVQMKHKYER